MVMTLDEKTMIELVTALAESATMSDAVDLVVGFAVRSTGTAFGGITLIQAGGRRFETVGATHPDVLRADQLQYELREGPCIDAAVMIRSLHSESLADDPRWPRWGPAVAELGFHSIISAEVHGRGQRIGALNLYGSSCATFSPDDVEMARMFAGHGAIALANARSEETLLQALETRTLIGQAQGILMERFDLDADHAFSVLRRYSQESNRRISEIVAEIVATRQLPECVEAIALE
jgi:GAF domain-containing protein